MGAPTGKLIFTSYESREGSKTRLYIFGGLFLVGLLMCLLGSQSGLLLIGMLICLIAAGLFLVTLPYAFRQGHMLELYDDGLIWRMSNNKSVKRSALWSEVQDVTLPDKDISGLGLGNAGASFGLAGIVVGAAADSLLSTANNRGPAQQEL